MDNRCELEVDVVQVDQNGRPTGSWLCCLPCYWLKRNNSVHKASLTVATLLVTVLLVASPVLFLISSAPEDRTKDCHYQENECPHENSPAICEETQCKTAASRILSSMSWKTDPCQDFYQFACGSWAKKVESLEEKQDEENNNVRFNPSISFDTLQQSVDRTIQQLLAVSANSEPFQKLGTFYKSCLRAGDKRVSLMPMFSLLNDLGGYIPPDGEEPVDLTPLIVSLLRLNGAPLFDVYLDIDLHNSSKLAPVVDLPLRFGFNTRFWWYRYQRDLTNDFRRRMDYFPRIVKKREASSPNNSSVGADKKMNKAYAFMKATIEEKRLLVMEKIMQEFMPENMTAETKAKETHNTLLLVTMLTKLYPREKEIIRSQLRDVNLETNVTDLEKRYPFIRWRYLFQQTFNSEISAEDTVYILAPTYLESLQKLVPRFNKRVIHNGLLLIYATDTLNELVNSSSSGDWPAFCTRVSVNVFSKAVSALYVRQYRPEYLDQLRMRVTHMFETLKKTFESRIRAVSWLDEKTREAVLGKLASLHGQFLTWPNFWNTSYVASLFDDVRIDPEDFFGNVIRRYQQLRTVPVDFRNRQSEDKRWAYPFVVNAFYALTMNTIIIPLAVLTQPYFRADVPRYVPYSTVGLIFAHEILHGFDLKGVGYDSNGEPGNLLSPESRAKLEARLDCVVRQYSSTFWKKVNFLGTNVDVQFDWNVTKNENMADISGLQMAFQAWKSVTDGKEPTLPGVNLNAQQLFFLNAAQTYCSMLSPADYILLVEVDFHTPHPERVNGIMMNSPSFAEAYQCPTGSPMNPRKKCSTW